METLSEPAESRIWSGYYQSRQRAQSLKNPRIAHNCAQLKLALTFRQSFSTCFQTVLTDASIIRDSKWPCVRSAEHALRAAQSCPTLCSLMDFTPPGSSVHGFLQAGILEWVAISSSKASSWPRDWTGISCLAGGFIITGDTWEANALLEGPNIEKLTQSGDQATCPPSWSRWKTKQHVDGTWEGRARGPGHGPAGAEATGTAEHPAWGTAHPLTFASSHQAKRLGLLLSPLT